MSRVDGDGSAHKRAVHHLYEGLLDEVPYYTCKYHNQKVEYLDWYPTAMGMVDDTEEVLRHFPSTMRDHYKGNWDNILYQLGLW